LAPNPTDSDRKKMVCEVLAESIDTDISKSVLRKAGGNEDDTSKIGQLD
jgi:hypothetical protein